MKSQRSINGSRRNGGSAGNRLGSKEKSATRAARSKKKDPLGVRQMIELYEQLITERR